MVADLAVVAGLAVVANGFEVVANGLGHLGSFELAVHENLVVVGSIRRAVV